MPLDLVIDPARLADVCRRHHVAMLELFGSRAAGVARPDSDVDLLVTFLPGRTSGFLSPNGFMALIQELDAVLGCQVDLLTRSSVEKDPNQYFRANALGHTEILYAA